MEHNSKIALLGIHEQGLDIVKYLKHHGVIVDTLITLNKEVAEKNNASGWVDYTSYAKKEGLEIYYGESYGLRSENDIKYFKKKTLM